MEPCYNCAMTLASLDVYRVVAKHAYHGASRTRDLFARLNIILVTQVGTPLY